LEAFPLGGIAGFGQAICQLEEAVVLGLFGLQAGFDQVNQDPAGGRMTGFCQGSDPLRDARRQRDALSHGRIRSTLSNGLIEVSHVPILEQFGRGGAGALSESVQE
jgi:hypothetical protein